MLRGLMVTAGSGEKLRHEVWKVYCVISIRAETKRPTVLAPNTSREWLSGVTPGVWPVCSGHPTTSLIYNPDLSFPVCLEPPDGGRETPCKAGTHEAVRRLYVSARTV